MGRARRHGRRHARWPVAAVADAANSTCRVARRPGDIESGRAQAQGVRAGLCPTTLRVAHGDFMRRWWGAILRTAIRQASRHPA